jgi:hypothetical protein
MARYLRIWSGATRECERTWLKYRPSPTTLHFHLTTPTSTTNSTFRLRHIFNICICYPFDLRLRHVFILYTCYPSDLRILDPKGANAALVKRKLSGICPPLPTCSLAPVHYPSYKAFGAASAKGVVLQQAWVGEPGGVNRLSSASLYTA